MLQVDNERKTKVTQLFVQEKWKACNHFSELVTHMLDYLLEVKKFIDEDNYQIYGIIQTNTTQMYAVNITIANGTQRRGGAYRHYALDMIELWRPNRNNSAMANLRAFANGCVVGDANIYSSETLLSKYRLAKDADELSWFVCGKSVWTTETVLDLGLTPINRADLKSSFVSLIGEKIQNLNGSLTKFAIDFDKVTGAVDNEPLTEQDKHFVEMLMKYLGRESTYEGDAVRHLNNAMLLDDDKDYLSEVLKIVKEFYQ